MPLLARSSPVEAGAEIVTEAGVETVGLAAGTDPGGRAALCSASYLNAVNSLAEGIARSSSLGRLHTMQTVAAGWLVVVLVEVLAAVPGVVPGVVLEVVTAVAFAVLLVVVFVVLLGAELEVVLAVMLAGKVDLAVVSDSWHGVGVEYCKSLQQGHG